MNYNINIFIFMFFFVCTYVSMKLLGIAYSTDRLYCILTSYDLSWIQIYYNYYNIAVQHKICCVSVCVFFIHNNHPRRTIVRSMKFFWTIESCIPHYHIHCRLLNFNVKFVYFILGVNDTSSKIKMHSYYSCKQYYCLQLQYLPFVYPFNCNNFIV